MPEKTPRDPQPAPHDLILESRARLTVTGVQKVLHCNADSAAMETGKGTLHLTGAQLNMAALDLETGEAKFTGRIDTLEYTAQRTGGRFSAPPAAMIPVLPPAALGQEIAACTVLGASIGALRAVFPARGRAAFVPDLVWVGAVLAAVQSYAAGQSSAGVLRWYMAAAAFAGAGAAAFVLGAPLRAAGGILQRRVLRPAERRRTRRRKARKLRRSAKRTAKKRKKNLPNQRRMMYNSYVLK